MRRALLAITFVLLAGVGITTTAPRPVGAAATSCYSDFIILKPWYQGLMDDSSCELKKVSSDEKGEAVKAKAGTTIGLTIFVWTIVLNVLDDIFRVVGVAATGYLIWGGYQYMLARGRSEKISGAKLTITNAVVGLAIAILGGSIVNLFLRIILD
ncbi:MAG: pilin [Candidatus Nomurabacteria bacterium]|jgi:hypothetical protein|nr:pilin [Candidatus Nomurabacteria bacterium]